MREFPKTAIKIPNAPPVRAYVLTCSKCGETEKVTTNNYSGAMSAERLNVAFRNKGWIVGKKPSGDVCPKCQERKGSNVVMLKKEPVVAQIVAEPPRDLNKEDRRLIFAKIDEVYLDKSYSKDWTDKKVAIDLGVPVAWVARIREENFGPEGIGDEQIKMMAEAREVAKKLTLEYQILDGHIKEGEKVRTELMTRANAIIGKLSEIEKRIS